MLEELLVLKETVGSPGSKKDLNNPHNTSELRDELVYDVNNLTYYFVYLKNI